MNDSEILKKFFKDMGLEINFVDCTSKEETTDESRAEWYSRLTDNLLAVRDLHIRSLENKIDELNNTLNETDMFNLKSLENIRKESTKRIEYLENLLNEKTKHIEDLITSIDNIDMPFCKNTEECMKATTVLTSEPPCCVVCRKPKKGIIYKFLH